MKYKTAIAPISAPILLLMSFNLFAQDNLTLSDAFKNGTFSFDSRVFYFNRSFDKPGVEDAEALTAGGIMKYESGKFMNTRLGLAYYGSHSLFNIIDRDKGGGTSLLQSSGEDIAFLGEAFIDFDNGRNQVKVGRQRLSTPLMNDHDLRLLPSVYEAAVYRNKSLPDTTLEAGYVSRYSGFTSKLSDFDAQNATWGNDGLAYVYGKTKLGSADVRGQYIATLDDSGSVDNYTYLDGNLPIGVGHKSYIKAQYGGTAYQLGDDSSMYGLKAGTTFGKLDVAVLYNTIKDNNFRAVEAGPMYSDWQQGYGNYEPSDALGVQLVYHPMDKASLKLGYVEVDSDVGPNFIDSFSEFNLDANYAINKDSKIRLRYSIKDQDSTSSREDRDDFRIIYYHNF